jgi:hypothetical protein
MLRRVVTNTIVKCEKVQFSAARSMSSKVEPYTERQNRTGRPVSPHVTIYKWPVAAVSSVLNRATGMTLTVGQ